MLLNGFFNFLTSEYVWSFLIFPDTSVDLTRLLIAGDWSVAAADPRLWGGAEDSQQPRLHSQGPGQGSGGAVGEWQQPTTFCLSCLSSFSFSLTTILYFCSVLLCFPCNKFLVSAVYFCSDETRVASVPISRRVSNLLCHNYRLPENESRDSSQKSRHLVKEWTSLIREELLTKKRWQENEGPGCVPGNIFSFSSSCGNARSLSQRGKKCVQSSPLYLVFTSH